MERITIQSPQLPTEPSRRPQRGALGAILHLRCPRCRRGLVLRGRFAMNNLCPVCGLKFDREPGYFVGAMYVSYAMAALVLGVFTFVISLYLPDLPLYALLGIAIGCFLPLVPLVFRYSRVIWMSIDRAIDPGE
jgi:uncharacterized protein (DUF983 family)